MLARWLKCILACNFFVFTPFNSGSASPIKCASYEKKIELQVKRIRSTSAANVRDDKAVDLAAFVHAHPNCAIRSAVVDDIASLLDDDDDGVRWGIALALKNIGPPAITAVPKLEKALRESDEKIAADPSPVTPTVYSGQTIRQALKSITGKPVPEYGEEPRP